MLILKIVNFKNSFHNRLPFILLRIILPILDFGQDLNPDQNENIDQDLAQNKDLGIDKDQ